MSYFRLCRLIVVLEFRHYLASKTLKVASLTDLNIESGKRAKKSAQTSIRQIDRLQFFESDSSGASGNNIKKHLHN